MIYLYAASYVIAFIMMIVLFIHMYEEISLGTLLICIFLSIFGPITISAFIVSLLAYGIMNTDKIILWRKK